MAAVELNLDPDKKQLMQFGLIGLVALPLIAWLFNGKPTPATWEVIHTQRIGPCAAIGAVMGMLGLIRPTLLKWVFVGASLVTFPIGFVLGEVLMFAIYLVAFAPMALLFKIIGRDALGRSLKPNAESYWQPKQQPKDLSSYYRQS